MSDVSTGDQTRQQVATDEMIQAPPRRGRRPRAAEDAQKGSKAPTSPRSKARSAKLAADADPSASSSGKMSARRRATPRGRVRESGVLGLAGRARLFSDQAIPYLLPDSLATTLPTIRQALFSRPLEDALRAVAEE